MPRLPAPRLLTVCLLLIGCALTSDPPPPPTVTVYAAASTADVMDQLARRFEQRTGIEVVAQYASSSTLARQIAAGARASVFLSANPAWMDHLEERGLVDPGTRRDLLGNELLVVVPARPPPPGAAGPDAPEADLHDLLHAAGRIAVADPAHVPAGLYARQALERRGWLAALQERLVPAVNVRAALRLAELDEVDAAIVYATDAGATDRVRGAARFDAADHDRIRYPVAARAPATPEALLFLEYLASAEAAAVFTGAGFTVIEAPTP